MTKLVAAFTEIVSVSYHAISRFQKFSHSRRRTIGVWGDGNLGYITSLLLKKMLPDSKVCIFGVNANKLSDFSFADATCLVSEIPEENCQKLALLWMNIASEFANYDSRLAFAGTNEVHIRDNWGKPTAENLEVQNAYNQIFVDMVRATGGNNAKRHLILQTYVCNPWFGVENGDFIIPKDAEGNGNNYMSVEFHYYQPWSYAGDCTYDYWGDAYKDAGKIPSPLLLQVFTALSKKSVIVFSLSAGILPASL